MLMFQFQFSFSKQEFWCSNDKRDLKVWSKRNIMYTDNNCFVFSSNSCDVQLMRNVIKRKTGRPRLSVQILYLLAWKRIHWQSGEIETYNGYCSTETSLLWPKPLSSTEARKFVLRSGPYRGRFVTFRIQLFLLWLRGHCVLEWVLLARRRLHAENTPLYR